MLKLQIGPIWSLSMKLISDGVTQKVL